MVNEMDLLGMTGHQRLCWLQANRITLQVVGLVWIGLILERLVSGGQPWFLIAMIPTFALVRFVAYRYCRRSDSSDQGARA